MSLIISLFFILFALHDFQLILSDEFFFLFFEFLFPFDPFLNFFLIWEITQFIQFWVSSFITVCDLHFQFRYWFVIGLWFNFKLRILDHSCARWAIQISSFVWTFKCPVSVSVALLTDLTSSFLSEWAWAFASQSGSAYAHYKYLKIYVS